MLNIGSLATAYVVYQTYPMSQANLPSQRNHRRKGLAPTRRPSGRLNRIARTVGRIGLGAGLTVAGVGHLTTQREEFQAQVPSWVPADPDIVVIASGVVEIGLGTALILTPRAVRPIVGTATAAFFIVIFPGNIAQYIEGTDAFGLDSDQARLTRLFFQPVLVAWALWSTVAWTWLRDHLKRS